MATYYSANSLCFRMDKVMSLRKYTHEQQEEGKLFGLVSTSKIAAGSLLKDTEPPIVIRLDPSLHVDGLRYEHAMPWMKTKKSYESIFDESCLQKTLQEYMPCTLSLRHSDERGDFCENGGCSRCGVHVTTTAALNMSSVESLQNQTSPYHRWIKNLRIDRDRIADSLQFFEILLITDFILKGETEIRRHGMYDLVPQFAEYVWTMVGAFRTCAFSLYAPVHTQDHVKYNEWLSAFEKASTKFSQLMALHEASDEFRQAGLGLHKLVEATPVKPDDMFVAFVSLHHKISYVNAPGVNDVANVELEQSITNKGTCAVFEAENFVHFLNVLKDIQKGDPLYLEYNQTDSRNYFFYDERLGLWSVVQNDSTRMRPGIKKFLRRFSGKLPPYVQRILEECI